MCVQLKRLVAQDDFGGACCSRLGWKDMVAVLKSALQDLKAGDRRSDCHLKCSAVYSIAREATSILERSASLAPYRLSVRSDSSAHRYHFAAGVLRVPSSTW